MIEQSDEQRIAVAYDLLGAPLARRHSANPLAVAMDAFSETWTTEFDTGA